MSHEHYNYILCKKVTMGFSIWFRLLTPFLLLAAIFALQHQLVHAGWCNSFCYYLLGNYIPRFSQTKENKRKYLLINYTRYIYQNIYWVCLLRLEKKLK